MTAGSPRGFWFGLYACCLPVGLAMTVHPARGQSAGGLDMARVLIDEAGIGWQRSIGDIDGDGRNDVVALVDEPPSQLCWYRYPELQRRTLVLLNTAVHGWPYFRTDALCLADVDGDGHPDVVTRIGDDGDLNGQVVWFENPRPAGVSDTWVMHTIGANFYTKDIAVVDVDRDGRLDVITREESRTQIWFQDGPDNWFGVQIGHDAREGMDVGDLDGDGDPDIVLNGFWFQTPSDPRTGTYTRRTINARWFDGQDPNRGQVGSCKVALADVDRDGRLDVILSHSEQTGHPVVWYSATDAVNGPWVEHTITVRCDYCHSLQTADFNDDGWLDVLAGGRPGSNMAGLTAFLGNGGGAWTPVAIEAEGAYSAIVGDIEDDGDIDVVNVRSYDRPPTEIWRNQRNTPAASPGWTYVLVDDARAKWGDFDDPVTLRYFGLGWGDVTGDGFADVVSGRYFYRNPRGAMSGPWPRVDFGFNVDALLVVDVDGDAFGDVIGTRGPDVFWLEADDAQGTSWTARPIDTTAPYESHVNPQGYAIADLVPGGRPEVILSNGERVFYYTIPTANPEAGNWPRTTILSASNSEGVGIADIDRDGDLDIAAAHWPANASDSGPRDIKWARNPGDGSGNWPWYILGQVPGAYPDRVAATDLNGDGRPDVVVSEETSDNNASTWWFEAPADPASGAWTRRLIVTQYTTNSMDVADMDDDGDVDIVLAEHRSAANNEKLAIWYNDGTGSFSERIVDVGKEGHLGARTADLDGDGDFEILSIAWDDYRYLHLWVNHLDPSADGDGGSGGSGDGGSAGDGGSNGDDAGGDGSGGSGGNDGSDAGSGGSTDTDSPDGSDSAGDDEPGDGTGQDGGSTGGDDGSTGAAAPGCVLGGAGASLASLIGLALLRTRRWNLM